MTSRDAIALALPLLLVQLPLAAQTPGSRRTVSAVGALLLQQNDPELKRLTRTGAPS